MLSPADLSALDLPSLAMAAEHSAQRDFDDLILALSFAARVDLSWVGVQRQAMHLRAQANDAATNALLIAFVAEHWAVLEPVLSALAAGDRVEVEEVAPVRATGDERPALALVAR